MGQDSENEHPAGKQAAGKNEEVQQMRILMIGNSFTYFNEMPDTVRQMARTAGLPAQIGQITYGGFRLAQYADETCSAGKETADKLKEHPWDLVVLQEQSFTPCRDPEQFRQSVLALTAKIRDCGAKPVLYQTWSYRNHTERLASVGLSCQDFTLALRDAYREAAALADAALVPVGTAFYLAVAGNPELGLFADDDYHPSPAGSYLAACMLFSELFGRTEIPDFLPKDVSPADAELLRDYARRCRENPDIELPQQQ